MNYKDFHTKAGLVIGSPGFRVFDPLANLSALNITTSGMYVSGDTDIATMFSTAYQRVRWDDVSSLVIAASSSWNGGTVYIPNSGNWDDAYTTVSTYSAGWGSGGSGGTIHLPQSADWNLAYSTVTANSASWASSGGTGGTGTGISPNSFVALTTAYNGTGINITWTRSLFRYTVTFDTPQTDTDYIVLTDNEGRDDVFMSVSNKTLSSFTIDSFDDDGQVLRNEPTIVLVYGSDPTSSSGGGSTGTISLPQSADWNTAYSSITANSADWNTAYSSITANSADWDLATTSWTTITANSADWLAGTSGGGASGAAFVTDIVISDATVTNITRDTTQIAVDSKTPILTAETDGKLVTFTVQWDSSTSYWTGFPQVSGHDIAKADTQAIAGQGRRYQGEITLDLSSFSGSTVIPVTFEGGQQDVTLALAGAGPEVQNFNIISTPQHGQNHYKQDDTLTFVVEFDTTDVTSIELHGSNAAHGSVATLVPTSMNGVSGTFTTFIDVPTNNVRDNRPVVLTARNSFGTQGTQYTSATDNKLVDSVYGPVVQSVTITSSPSFSQDHYKSGDDITMDIEFDTTNVANAVFNGSGVTRTQTVAPSLGLGTKTLSFGATIEESSNTKASRPVKVKGRVAGDTIGGADFTSGNIVSTMKGPVVTALTTTGTIPYSQTHYKDGDTVVLQATFDTTNIDHVDFIGTNQGTGTYNGVSRSTGGGTTGGTFNTTVDVPTNVTSPQSFGVQMRANNGTADGANFTFSNVFQAMHGPVLSNGTFGSYPGGQTELKVDDDLQVTFDVDTTNINQIFFSAPSTTGAQKSLTRTGLSPVGGKITTTMTVGQTHSANTGQDNSIGGKNYPVRASGKGNNHTGYGPIHTSTNQVIVNNQEPVIGSISVVYTTGAALSGSGDTAQVTANISSEGTNPTGIYTDNGTNELTVTDPTVINNTKTVTYAGGNFRESGLNYKVSITRTTNDTNTQATGLVKIAAAAPTITISSNNGQAMKSNASGINYTINLTSDQILSVAPTLKHPHGTLAGQAPGNVVTFTGSGKNWQATMNVKDSDTKGTHTYTDLVAINEAGVTQNTISTGGTYTFAGFSSRTLTLGAFNRAVSIGTHVADYTKLIVSEDSWRAKTITLDTSYTNGTTLNPDLAVGEDVLEKYTITDSSNPNVVDLNGDMIWYLDKVAVNQNGGGTMQFTVEETI